MPLVSLFLARQLVPNMTTPPCTLTLKRTLAVVSMLPLLLLRNFSLTCFMSLLSHTSLALVMLHRSLLRIVLVPRSPIHRPLAKLFFLFPVLMALSSRQTRRCPGRYPLSLFLSPSFVLYRLFLLALLVLSTTTLWNARMILLSLRFLYHPLLCQAPARQTSSCRPLLAVPCTKVLQHHLPQGKNPQLSSQLRIPIR